MFNQRGAVNFVAGLGRSMQQAGAQLYYADPANRLPGAKSAEADTISTVFKFVFWPAFIWSKLKWRLSTEKLMLLVPLITCGIYSAGAIVLGSLGSNYSAVEDEIWQPMFSIHVGTTIAFWVVVSVFYMVRGTYRGIRNGSRRLALWVKGGR